MSEIKPLLRQMIDNNKPHWRPETIRGAHKQLDEYEAKAEALDRAREKVYARISHIIMTSQPHQRKPGYVDGLYNALDIISEEYEIEEESD